MIDLEIAKTGPIKFTEPELLDSFVGFPQPTRRQLQLNVAYSLRFVAEAARRQTWFDQFLFRIYASICSDGRNAVLEEALGEGLGPLCIPASIIETDRSTGGMNGLDSPATVQILEHRFRRDRQLGKGVIAMQFAHWSSSHADSASCAALEHNTDAAMNIAQLKADEMNFVAHGNGVSFAARFDTDFRSIKVIGESQSLDTLEAAHDRKLKNRELNRWLIGKLHDCFPENWRPIMALENSYRRAFYPELASRLAFNVAYVRGIARLRRPVELLSHEERLLVVGPNVVPAFNGYNSVFCCDSHSQRLPVDFAIGLRFVTINTVIDAARNVEQKPLVPIIISAIYNENDGLDHRMKMIHVRHLRDWLQTVAAAAFPSIKESALSCLHAKGMHDASERLVRHLDLDQFLAMLSWCTCVSSRQKRQLKPFK